MVPLLLFGVALAARAAVGILYIEPAYADSFYYVNVARELAAGNGFQVNYVWNFIDVGGVVPTDPGLPIPSNAHWMPLGAAIQVPFVWLMGPSPLAAAMPFWLVGALAAPISYRIGLDIGLRRGVAATGGLLTAVPLGMTPFMAQPDNFGLFMTLAALTLWMAGRGASGNVAALILAGAVAGLAMLSRNDGVLLVLPIAIAAVMAMRRSEERPAMLRAAILAAAAFLAVTGPWLLRQLFVFGSISPSAASGRVLWITDFDRMWSVTDPPSLSTFLASGWEPIVSSRIDGIVATLLVLTVTAFAGALLPFALIGAWRHRRQRALAPYLIYAPLLIGASALVFSVLVPSGMFIHSVGALLPHGYVLAAAGVSVATKWVASRRPSWDARQATRVFLAGAVMLAVVAAGLQTSSTITSWQAASSARQQLAHVLSAIPAEQRIMAADPGALSYAHGLSGVVTPHDPLDVVEDVARAYRIQWLWLEGRSIVPALQPVLRGETVPPWISLPVASVTAEGAPDTFPRAALYAICTEITDRRCDR